MFANSNSLQPLQQAQKPAASRKFGNDLTTNQNQARRIGGGVKHNVASAPVERHHQQQQLQQQQGLRSNAAHPEVVRIENIDATDRGNPQCVAEYAESINQWARETESLHMPPANYMDLQKNINEKMRSILVDWLIEVHLKFKLVPETLFLTINLIDRYLARRPCPRRKLQLVGVTCMLIASKYEEIYFPEVQDFVYITDKAYSRQEILQMEGIVLNALKFDLTVPTSLVFLKRYLKAAKADERVTHMAYFFTERMLQQYDMIGQTASAIAASAVSMALRVYHRPGWTATLKHYSNYTEHELKDCIGKMSRILLQKQNLQAVSKKYSSSKFGKASTVPLAPTLFALSSGNF